MSPTPADTSNQAADHAGTATGSQAACALSRPLRSLLTAELQAASAARAALSGKALMSDQETDSRRRAALFALDNFVQLQDASANFISEESLWMLLRHGRLEPSAQPHVSLLLRQLSSFGHVVGKRTSTTHVATHGAAMPITFSVPVYVIDALDLFKMICKTGRWQVE